MQNYDLTTEMGLFLQSSLQVLALNIALKATKIRQSLFALISTAWIKDKESKI